MKKALPKIEGHATFYTHLKAGRVDKAKIMGLEGERFVEKILLGRKFYQAPIITSRICGICPIIHSVTSTKAIEAAVGIKASPQTETLRELMLIAQMIQSHSLHLYLLVLPDFMGVGSSFELQNNHPDIFANAIELKKYADSIIETIGGRAVHPVSNVPGGFKKLPEISKLKNILKTSSQVIDIAQKTVQLFASFNYPKISRKIIYSALYAPNEYAIYQGDIKNTAGNKFSPKNYSNYIYEELVPYNRAKFATLRGKEMMVGALARIVINKNKLNSKVIDIIKEQKIPTDFDNPFDNILAQALENYHFALESQKIIKSLISHGIKKEKIIEPNKFGLGVTACEAPRGTLFHSYTVDKNYNIVKCDIITPTVQNLPSTEFDMKKMAPLIRGKKPAERDHLIEMLIRAYDPCVTCATH